MRLGVEAALVDGVLVPGDVEIDRGEVTNVGCAGGGRGIAVPGFVDLHVHGYGGVDFATADTDGYRQAGAALLAAGVTAFNATLVTAPVDELVQSLRAIPTSDVGPRVLGAHLEGPFISAARLGMHPADARRDPDVALVAKLLDAGPVTHMTLAPELPGADALLGELDARGIVAACGHTDADAEQAHAAFDAGATHVTHLFNAMRPFGHRDPGLAGAALARDDVTVELILDGNHVAPEAARIAWKAARGRVVLVTDAVAAAGIGDGPSRLGTVDVVVEHGVVRRLDGVLAGSVVSMPEAIRNLMSAGATLEQAVDAATRVPASAARRPDVGQLRPGARADVVVIDERVEVIQVIVGGVGV